MKKQLKLFTPFFHVEIDFKNDYLSYIDTTHKNVTSVIHNNTIKQQESKNRNHIMACQA